CNLLTNALLSDTSQVQNHFARLSRDHRVKSLLKVVERESVRNHRRNIQSRLDHHRHLVPRVIHLPAIDALDRDHVEDHLPPVHRDLLRRDTQDRNLPAVAHVCNHVFQRQRIPPLTISLSSITPSAPRLFSATTRGVPPERAICSTVALTSVGTSRL